MIWNPRKRLTMVLFTLVNLLFMQLAMAGYACPGSSSKAQANQAAAMIAAGMPCAETAATTMDGDQPGLCAVHCKADKQTTDQYKLPVLATLDAAPRDYPPPGLNMVSLDPPVQAPLLARITVKPVTVRHCCFRL
jgi:hypothetical protein